MLYSRFDSDDTTETLLQWKIGLTVLHSVAIISTIFRVSYRHHIRRLWWDDYLAVIPAVLEIVYLVTLWLRVEGSSGPRDFIKKQTALYWVSSVPFLCIIWATRICLTLSIARIFAPMTTPRRFALTLVVMFTLTWIGLMISKTVTSLPNDRQGTRQFFERADCNGGEDVCIAGFTLDITSDFILMVSPLFMLWHIKLPMNQRYLIFAVFSASFWSLSVAIVYALCTFSPIKETLAGSVLLIMMPHIESVIDVFVCNLSVIVSFFYRTFRHYGDMDTVATSGQPSETAPMMTTINSSSLLSSSVVISTTIMTTNDTSLTSINSSSDDIESSPDSKPSSTSTSST